MHYALPTRSKYPIDTAEQVKTASAYLSRYLNQLHPAERMAMATNLEKRAQELGIVLDDDVVHNYSRTGTEYSPDFDLHMTMRKQAAHGIKVKMGEDVVDAGDVMGKIALMKMTLKPTEMVDLLHDFDKRAALEPKYDHGIRDPFFTVYGSVHNPKWNHEKIAATVYAKELEHAVHHNDSFMSKIADSFGKDFADGLKADPENVFASMPTPEREMILNHLKDSADEA